MIELRNIENDNYIIGCDTEEDTISVSLKQIALLKDYGITIEGIKLKLDGTLLKAVPRTEDTHITDEEEKIAFFEKHGYFRQEGQGLPDLLSNILSSLAVERDLMDDTRIDREFFDIVRPMYPNIAEILSCSFPRSDRYKAYELTYCKATNTLPLACYKSIDMFYRYPEFAKIVNNATLLIMLGSVEKYRKYVDCDVLNKVDWSVTAKVNIPYLEKSKIFLKITDKSGLPFTSVDSERWYSNNGTLILDATEVTDVNIIKLLPSALLGTYYKCNAMVEDKWRDVILNAVNLLAEDKNIKEYQKNTILNSIVFIDSTKHLVEIDSVQKYQKKQ